MPNGGGPPSNGTLVVAALLVLGLVFASYWIRSAVLPPGDTSWVRWFAVAVGVILVAGFYVYVRADRGKRGP